MFLSVANMLKVVWSALVSFTLVHDRRIENVPKHT